MVVRMGAIRWGTRGTRPHHFSDSGDIICHVPHIFLFRLRNIVVHTKLCPSHVTTKLRLWWCAFGFNLCHALDMQHYYLLLSTIALLKLHCSCDLTVVAVRRSVT